MKNIKFFAHNSASTPNITNQMDLIAQEKSRNNIIAQQILLNWHGYILESTDTLFDTKRLRHRPASEWSYFFGSLVPVIHLLELSSPEILLPRISSVTNFTQGIYDCTFMRVEWGDTDDVIVWTIFDNSESLPQLQATQQRLNEIRMRGL